MLELNYRVTPDPDVVITELEGKEAVLLHLGTKMYFTLNETGLWIWQMLSSGLTPGEISEIIQPKSCKRFSQCENQYFPLPRLAKSDNRYPFFSNCGSAIVLL
ncbi:hypothetical protein KsCSTR_21500 [Candidatus Kuenenia stuttgartiensis]|uniref:PqqD family protein n=1 Tax=Kuenenia stuttgartiensis TaxID=174633 RepID=Q1Q331_KUEST|nr:PqqD family protein [Candidatus Kuenenia stuttgartiensis]QII11529.1 hypothetical protein KsCSTR_21500 [Candidatus Kuenenia stuttgartiensis]CAJ74425.1 Hypothetical Protein kuste3662 [Candidatus Kuenenia stuttgartiensis]